MLKALGVADRHGHQRFVANQIYYSLESRDAEYELVPASVDIAASHGASPAQISLAYLLRKPAVTSLIIGARVEEQLSDNLGAADVSLSDEEFDQLDKVSAPWLIYPHWHQALTASDRFGAADRALHTAR